jgi:aldose 1-epimerase
MINTFTMENQVCDSVNIIYLGARLVEWHTRVKGQSRNIIVGYTDYELYREDPSHMGAIAGPYANRIKNAQVEISGVAHQLAANEGNNILHSGSNALESCMWQVKEHSTRAITLTYWLEDGFNGFPGAIAFEVEYRLAENESQLKINMNAVSEKETIVGPTGHAYFNLSKPFTNNVSSTVSNKAENINQHSLLLNCQQYTPVDSVGIPTGDIDSVKNTELDFTQLKKIDTTPINHNFVVTDINHASAVLISPEQDLSLEVSSDYPGLQVYTADYLSSPFISRQGICLEPQFYPDSPNIKQFPFYTTSPERPFSEKIIYKLKK